MATIIKNGNIVTEKGIIKGDLLIQDGVIRKIGDCPDQEDSDVIHAENQWVCPGGIDVHTHLNLHTGKTVAQDDFYTGTVAAACGGTTSIVDHMGFGPKGCDLFHQLNVYHDYAKDHAVVDYGFHGVVQHVDDRIVSQVESLVDAGLPTVKAYMTYAFKLDDSELIRIMEALEKADGLLTIHAEEDEVISRLRSNYLNDQKTDAVYHALSRPDFSESDAIERAIRLAGSAGNAPLYFVHVSTRDGLESIRKAQSKGQKVMAETCPQYLLLDRELYQDTGCEGLKYIMSPPLRTKESRLALWEGIKCEDISVVATDHCPFDFTKKITMGKDDFSLCPGGIPGIETRVPLMFSEGVVKRNIPIERFVDLVSTNPARIMGLYPEKGVIAPGSDADIMIIDPGLKNTIAVSDLHENVDYTPYEGRQVMGWPVMTMVRGEVIVREGEFLGRKGFGKFIKRKRFDSSFANL